MKAIVLTYDKYKIFADHMIRKYCDLWPDNPFIFQIPYQDENIKEYFESRYGKKVETIKTPSGIVDTMDVLLKDLADDEWVYWCMDDRYPISLNTICLNSIHSWITSPSSENISGLMFVNSPWGRLPENLYYNKHKLITEDNFHFLRRKGYRMIWIHQYLKVKVLKTLFDNFRVKLSEAKDMDYILYTLKLPEDQKLFALNHNIGTYGESTSRGKVTKNCAQSLTNLNFELPSNFGFSEKTIIQGDNNTFDDLLYFINVNVKKVLGFKNKE